MSKAWQSQLGGAPASVPRDLELLSNKLRSRHPLQSPTLWGLRKGGVAYTDGVSPWWVYGDIRKRALRPFGRGPAYRIDAFIPVGNQLAGDPSISESPDTIHALLAALPALGTQALLFEELDLDSSLARAVMGAGSNRSGARSSWLRGGVPAWLLKLPEQRARYWDKFSSKSRNTLNRKAKKLTGPLRMYLSPEDADAFMTAAAAVSERSWQHRAIGVRIKLDAQTLAFERQLAATGAMRSYVLYHDERPVAFVKGYMIGDVFFYDEGAYDESVANLSPGLALWVMILQQLTEEDSDVAAIDFGFGDAGFKAQLGTDTVLRSHLLVYPPRALISLVAGTAARSARAIDAIIARRNRGKSRGG